MAARPRGRAARPGGGLSGLTGGKILFIKRPGRQLLSGRAETIEKVAKVTFSSWAARNFGLDVVVASCGSRASVWTQMLAPFAAPPLPEKQDDGLAFLEAQNCHPKFRDRSHFQRTCRRKWLRSDFIPPPAGGGTP